VAPRETLMPAGHAADWEPSTRDLLDSYLREFGLAAGRTRNDWVERVITDMQARTDNIAPEDIAEEALEHLLQLVSARLALVARPGAAPRELARVQFLLMNRSNADALNTLFEHARAEPDAASRERVRQLTARCIPVPVPAEASLAMPEQAIELRTLNPLRRLFKRVP
jgi:hypothetical protein